MSVPTPIRPIVPTSNEAAVFHFVTVRTPRTAGTSLANTTGNRVATAAADLPSPFIDSLVLLGEQGGTEQEQLARITEAVQAKQESAAFIQQKAELLNALGGLIQFGRWLREQQQSLVIETVEQTQAQLNPQLASAAQLRDIRDALVADVIGGGRMDERESLLAALRAQHFLTHSAEAGRSAPALQQLAAVETVLPSELFPLPQVAVAVEARPDPEEAQHTVTEQTENIAKLAAYEKALKELRQLVAVRSEEARNIAQPTLFTNSSSGGGGAGGAIEFPSAGGVGFPDAGRTEFPSAGGANIGGGDIIPDGPTAEEQAQVQAWTEAQRRTQYIGDASALSAETAQLLSTIGSLTTLTIAFFISQLEQQAVELALTVGQNAPAYQQAFEAGGTLWTSQPPATLAGRQGIVKTTDEPIRTPFGNDAYEGFYPRGKGEGRIRPLGIADLNRVEQTLCCYKAGEVAHIENVMQGEYKERSTRLLRRTEETYELTTEREQSQERDTGPRTGTKWPRKRPRSSVKIRL